MIYPNMIEQDSTVLLVLWGLFPPFVSNFSFDSYTWKC